LFLNLQEFLIIAEKENTHMRESGMAIFIKPRTRAQD